ncbi:hypothetical protein [Streptomyces sp. NPDC056544]|uniref:hypothetical protein n=1 Tax=unclassified Streptomyces TaxID=2593676 RepID=UPI00369989ED
MAGDEITGQVHHPGVGGSLARSSRGPVGRANAKATICAATAPHSVRFCLGERGLDCEQCKLHSFIPLQASTRPAPAPQRAVREALGSFVVA